MKTLLIQIRKDAMKEQEYRCIAEKSGQSTEDLISFDIFERLIKPEDLNGYNALIIGGSGAYCVSEKEISVEINAIEEVIREARRRGIPILGLCFGHHLIAEALGGEVQQDRDRQETGTYQITQTDAGTDDPLFSRLPKTFLAQEGHKDHVTKLPPGAILLASSTLSPIQAFTFPGEAIYSVQFHPELARKDVLARLDFYRDLYLQKKESNASDAGSGTASFDAIIKATQETPEAEMILRLFFEHVVPVPVT